MAVDLLVDEFVPSWCRVGDPVVGAVLGGVCPVTPGVARGPCLAISACCVVGERGAFLERGCVELVLCGCGFIGFSAMEFTCGGGDLWHLGSGGCV
ncbi:hypothetical protein ILYODFUR_025908 [Ilyodon furcidens]|uniref:Uncharacterized protein n=1 Tax=Ilyodon furcidens TaxID=33524 RepID=A0ABV0VIR0_9TELE